MASNAEAAVAADPAPAAKGASAAVAVRAAGGVLAAVADASRTCWARVAGAASTNVARSSGAKRRRLSLGEATCSKRRATRAATPQAGRRLSQEAAASGAAAAFTTLDFGPYITIAAYLDAADLCRVDAVCRLMRITNAQPSGPWKTVGEEAFQGMELEVGGGFLPFEQVHGHRSNWKARYELFHRQVPTFSQPFTGSQILNVTASDEVAYCRCRLRNDLLLPGRGVYVEVEVLANADNLSLAVVDFEGGGQSSVTFSPETGAVLRERKVREAPRVIEGTYIHLLPAAPVGRRFEGTMGIYLRDGHLAFFRRWSSSGEGTPWYEPAQAQQSGPVPWETTGFCTDLRWAQGARLSLCLAFRDSGSYNVRIARVGRTPPSPPGRSSEAYQDNRWSLLYGDDEHPLAI